MNSTTALLSLSLLAACASTPTTLAPLTLHAPIEVTYEGSFTPLAAADSTAFAAPPPAIATANESPSVTFRSTLVELPLAEANELLPELLPMAMSATGPQVSGAHLDVLPMRRAIDVLMARGRVRTTPMVAARIGTSSSMSAVTNAAYVQSIKLTPMAAVFMADPVVASFEHGTQLVFSSAPQGDALQVGVEWRQRDPVEPIPVAQAGRFQLQVPVLAVHRLSAHTLARQNDAFVVGVVPGREPGSVAMLFVEIDASATAGRK